MRQLFQFVLIFAVILSSLLFSVSGFTQTTPSTTQSDTIQWHEWSNETFALAAQQNKPVLLDISAQWCQFCKKMKAITYNDPEVISIINKNYIAIHADIETTNDVQMLYGNLGVPGTVVLTATRDELNKRRGYIPPQQMQWHLLGSLEDLSTENNLNQTH